MNFRFALLMASSLTILTACNGTPSADVGAPVSGTVSTSQTESASQALTPTFDAPEGWARTDLEQAAQFTAPEGDVTMSVVWGVKADDVQGAAVQAWTRLGSPMERAVALESPLAASRGWSEITRFDYETSPAEERVISAMMHAGPGGWTVFTVDGSAATVGKRLAALRTTSETIAAPGYQAEELSGHTANAMTPERVEAMLAFLEDASAAMKIPGIGVGIIQNGEIIYAGGVGVADVETGAPITANTRFPIASNTKGMTTLLLAKLVEEGRLDWDDKVVDHYPDFRLGDAATTDQVLIRHLVCACTGLPRRDMEWIMNATADTSPSFVFDSLAESEPTSGFGEVYQYNNALPAAAGFIAGHILYPDMDLDAAYERAMREHIFEPLGMDRTTISYAKALGGDHARPYTISIDEKILPIVQTERYGFNHTVTHANPSGGAWSTPRGMLAYLDNELTAGTSRDGERRFAEGPLLERRVPGIRDGSNSTYGMGLRTGTISGIKIIQHGGSLAGYLSQIAIIPEADTAAVILTNSDFGRPLLAPFQRRLVELLYDAEPKAAAQVAAAAAANEALRAKAKAEIVFPADPAVMDTIATLYESPELGPVVFRRDETGSVMETGQWETPVATRQNLDGSVSIYPLHDAIPGEWVSFTIGETDGRRTLTLNDVQRAYVFTEVE